jgi:hypothetical protein
MFSAITVKQLQNILSIFEKNKATEKIYINDIEFEVERLKDDIFKIYNQDKNYEIRISNKKITDFKVETSKPDTIREVSIVPTRFLEGKQVWNITESVEGIKRFSFNVTINEESVEDLKNILGFVD